MGNTWVGVSCLGGNGYTNKNRKKQALARDTDCGVGVEAHSTWHSNRYACIRSDREDMQREEKTKDKTLTAREKRNQGRIRKNSEVSERRIQRKQGHGIKGGKRFRKEEMAIAVTYFSGMDGAESRVCSE